MRHLDEYRDAAAVRALLRELHEAARRPWTLMEVCGGQTHSILKFGLDALLPPRVKLIHGPGCPVCVTPLEMIDRALALASRPGLTFCSFGDMLRVPGSREDLWSVKAKGGDVRVVYSPLDALELARRHPERRVVFFAVGFETTAPASARAVQLAAKLGVANFSVLSAHVRVPPALDALLSCPDAIVQGLLAPGHVCTVAGYEAYERLAARYHLPVVVTGFEPVDLLRGVLAAVRQLEAGEARVENEYARAVGREGNAEALAAIDDVFVAVDRCWRGLGAIPCSGLALAERYAPFDAERIFELADIAPQEPRECKAGLVLQGRLAPCDCPEFDRRCTPEHPLGAPMVSSEGACAAYFRYRRPEPAILVPER